MLLRGAETATSGPDSQTAKSARPRHAGFGVRFGAALIDALIMGVPVYLLLSLVFGFDGGLEGLSFDWRSADTGETADLGTVLSPGFWLNLALLAGITILLWVNWDGRTPGKKLLGLRIVSYPDYGPFSYGTATIRSLLGVVSAGTLVGYAVIALMIALRPDKRGFHDLLAKTCVIHDE